MWASLVDQTKKTKNNKTQKLISHSLWVSCVIFHQSDVSEVCACVCQGGLFLIVFLSLSLTVNNGLFCIALDRRPAHPHPCLNTFHVRVGTHVCVGGIFLRRLFWWVGMVCYGDNSLFLYVYVCDKEICHVCSCLSVDWTDSSCGGEDACEFI